MNGRNIGKYVLEQLRRHYGRINYEEFIAPRIRSKGLFEFIVGVMLSQNTSDRNAIRAYNNLKKLLGGEITPEKILVHSFEELAEAIRVAGMHVQRTRRIIELAKIFRDIEFVNKLVMLINEKSVEEARRILMELPGIGAKTADIILLMYFNKPTFPVDTHISRITRRLGFVKRRNYEEIRSFWMNVLDPNDYLEAHLLLITHGRRICRARDPRCSECLLKNICMYYRGKMKK